MSGDITSDGTTSAHVDALQIDNTIGQQMREREEDGEKMRETEGDRMRQKETQQLFSKPTNAS